MVDKYIKVTVTDKDGKTFEDATIAPVVNDLSEGITLNDSNGLQTDGTALPGDELAVSYGATLGTPKNIIWYNNGAAIGVYTIEGGTVQQGFTSAPLIAAGAIYGTAGELKAGEYYVTIENTEGKTFITNSIVVAEQGKAAMSDVSIEDDYETDNMAGVELSKNTDAAILNVTFNKNYAGTLYLIDSKIESSYAGHDANKIAMNGVDGIKDALVKVTSKAQLTNKNATAAYRTATTGPAAWAKLNGVYYEDSEGALHCKFVVDLTGASYAGAAGQTVTRGSSYYLVWDQADIQDDEITTKSKKADLNVSADMVVPYVKAPASIKVSTFATGSKTVKVDALDENGEKLGWYTEGTGTNAALGLSSSKIFKVDTNAKSATDTSEIAGGLTVKEGTYTFTTAANIPNAYVYVQLKTVAGVFAKDSLTLESDLSESAREAVKSISLEEDATDPSAAVVKFTGLSSKAPGKVYIMQGNNATDEKLGVERDGNAGVTKADDAIVYASIAGHDLASAIAEAEVEGGAASVTIPNVFEATDMETSASTYGTDMGNNAFVAVFVPEDEQLWSRAYSLNSDKLGFQLAPTITTIDKSEMTATLSNIAANASDTAGYVITVAGIQAMDQFGNKWTGTASDKNAAAITEIKNTTTNTEVYAVSKNANGGATNTVTNSVDLAANGGISFAVLFGSNGSDIIDKGDGLTVKVAALKDLTVTIKAKGVVAKNATTNLTVDATAALVETGATLTTPGATPATYPDKLSAAFSVE